MPISLASYVIPKNGGQFFLMEDVNLKGGFRTLADVTARDAIYSVSIKDGMLVYTVAEAKYWRYDLATTTWIEIPLGVVGPVGPTGAAGTSGIDGPVGPTGPAGTFSGTFSGNANITGALTSKNTYTNLAAFPAATNLQGTTAVAVDTNKIYISNGTAWVEVQQAGTLPYDIALNVYGQSSTANDLLASFTAPRSINIAAGASGVASCNTAPTNSVTLTLKLGGTAIGTVAFAAGSTTGTVSITSAQTLAASSILTFVNSATPDTAIEDISFTLRGTV